MARRRARRPSRAEVYGATLASNPAVTLEGVAERRTSIVAGLACWAGQGGCARPPRFCKRNCWGESGSGGTSKHVRPGVVRCCALLNLDMRRNVLGNAAVIFLKIPCRVSDSSGDEPLSLELATSAGPAGLVARGGRRLSRLEARVWCEQTGGLSLLWGRNARQLIKALAGVAGSESNLQEAVHYWSIMVLLVCRKPAELAGLMPIVGSSNESKSGYLSGCVGGG